MQINSLARFVVIAFNPDPTKQAEEVILSRKKPKQNHISQYFGNSLVKQASSKKACYWTSNCTSKII